MEMTQYYVDKYSTNCYLLKNEETGEMIVIDPGADAKGIFAKCEEMGGKVVAILLTHAHYDHTTGVDELRALTGAKVYANEAEKASFTDSMIHLGTKVVLPDAYLTDGQVMTLGGMEFTAISTPGHTPGGMCFYFEPEKMLFSGDTLFRASVGRTDFKGSSMEALEDGIKNKLFCLPDDTKVLPGHMAATTIAYEKANNPFVR